MEQRRKKEKDTMLEMGSLQPDRKEENMVQMKRMHAESTVLSDDRTPDEAEDNESVHAIENELVFDDESSQSSCEEDEQSHVIDPNSCRGKLEHMMKSNVVQYCIIALVIADCIIIVLELLIDMEFIVFPEADPNQSHHDSGDSHPVAYASYSINSTTHQPHHNVSFHNSSSHDNSSHSQHHEHHHTNKEKAEHVLHAFSLGILSLFMVEVCLKIFLEGKHLLKQKAEVFDAVVVIVSFTLDIVFSFVSVESAAKDAAGLMVLLRLWRVTRIINGVILSVKIEAKKKTDALKKVVRQLEHDNRKQRSKIEKLEKENTLLKHQLVVFNDGSMGRTSTIILNKKTNSNPGNSIQLQPKQQTTELNNHGKTC